MSGKTNTSTSTIGYDPGALSAYQSGIGTSMPILQNMASNPYNNPFFNMQLGMMNKQAAQVGQRGMNNLFANSRQMNMPQGVLNPMLASGVARQGRATSALQAQGRFGAMQNAQQNQLFALSGLQNFQPLMTGSKTVEKQSGGLLGQLLGAGLSAGMGFLTGGTSGALASTAGAGGSGGAQGGGIGMSGGMGPGIMPGGFNTSSNWGNNPFFNQSTLPGASGTTPPFMPGMIPGLSF